MTVSITLVFLSDGILLSFLCRTSGLSHPGSVHMQDFQSCWAGGWAWFTAQLLPPAPSSLGLPLWALHVGFDPVEAQSWCNLRYLKPKWECGLPTVRGNILAQDSRPKRFTAGKWGIKDCFSLSATHDQRQAEGVFRQRNQLQSEGTNATFTVGIMGLLLLSWSSSIPSCCKAAFQ